MCSSSVQLLHSAQQKMGQTPSSGVLQVATRTPSHPAHPTKGAVEIPEHVISEQQREEELRTLAEKGMQPYLRPLSDIMRCVCRGAGGSARLRIMSLVAVASV